MNQTPPPVGPNLHQWAQSTRTWLQRWASNLRWRTARDTPSENGIIMWDEGTKQAVISIDGAWYPITVSVTPL